MSLTSQWGKNNGSVCLAKVTGIGDNAINRMGGTSPSAIATNNEPSLVLRHSFSVSGVNNDTPSARGGIDMAAESQDPFQDYPVLSIDNYSYLTFPSLCSLPS